MCGGGAPAMPAQPSPREQAEAREWEASQQAARDARAAAERKAEQAAAKAEADQKWSSGRGAAYTGAQQYGKSRLTSMGFSDSDPYGIADLYRSRIDLANQGLQTGDDYTSKFSPTVFDDVAGEVRGGQRTKYKQQFDQTVDPYFADDMFGSTADDQIINSILGSQYDDALGDITAARDRGKLNSAGYDRALKDLDSTRGTANSDLQRIGGGVLSSIIGDVGTRRQRVGDQINSWDFGDTLDIGREGNRVKQYATERQGGLEGDIRNAIGGKNYFDTSKLIGTAAARAGNPTTPTGGNSGGAGALLDVFKNQKQNEGVF